MSEPDLRQLLVPAELVPYLEKCLAAIGVDLYGPVKLPGVEDDLPTHLTRPWRAPGRQKVPE